MAENIINTRPRQLFSSKTGLGVLHMVSHCERTSYQISSSFQLGGCLTIKQLQLNHSRETHIICQEQTIFNKIDNVDRISQFGANLKIWSRVNFAISTVPIT